MDPIVQLSVTALVVLVASMIQRVTGMGFALAAAPPLVLLYGAEEGVRASMCTGLVLSAVMVSTLLRDVDWRGTGWLVLGGALAAPIGAWVTGVVPAQWLVLFVGVFALLSLLGGAWAGVRRAFGGARGAVIAGGLSGFMHVTSGLSGPPLAMYALQNQWSQRRFAASVQLVFIALSLFGLGFRGLPDMPLPELGVLSAAVVAGILIGSVAVRHIPAVWARRGMLAIAWAGTLTVLVRGAIDLLESR